MRGTITQVAPQTAKSFRDLNSGFKFEVVGDGRVEPEISDRFTSAHFLESMDDRKVRQFIKDQAQIAGENLPKDASQQRLQDSVEKWLGKDWTISSLSPGAAQQGVNCLSARLNEPGVGSQELYLSSYEKPSVATLTTSFNRDGWSISHTITGTQDGSQWTEAASFEK